MEKALNVASHICNKYKNISGELIDEMKLHKLLYLSQRECIAITGEPMFNDTFEGWRYGPVCVSVRNSFYEGEILSPMVEPVSKQCEYIVDNIINQYGELASWKLSQITHDEISWKKSREGLSSSDNGSVVLCVEDIKADALKVRPYDSAWDMYIDEFEDYEENT